jgi:tRNA(fMet)-specific endonuclease VapC
MTIKFLLDTNILSEPSRLLPNQNVIAQLNLHRYEIGIASVVLHEILYGYWRLPESKRKDKLGNYVQESVLILPVFAYDLAAAQYHAQERARLVKIGLTPAFLDGQIASIAVSYNLSLVTNNVADFANFQGLIIENWFVNKSES